MSITMCLIQIWSFEKSVYLDHCDQSNFALKNWQKVRWITWSWTAKHLISKSRYFWSRLNVLNNLVPHYRQYIWLWGRIQHPDSALNSCKIQRFFGTIEDDSSLEALTGGRRSPGTHTGLLVMDCMHRRRIWGTWLVMLSQLSEEAICVLFCHSAP